MSISYENLWSLLSEKGLNKTDLCEKSGITTNVMAKMSKNESVQVEILSKICGVLECSFDDIVSNTGENALITPLPHFSFDIFDDSNYGVSDEYETLGIKKLRDFPKPHTINNIKKFLIKYIQDSKLSIASVNVLLDELKKYGIHIVIDKNIGPIYEKLPRGFTCEDEESEIYKIEYQQFENYMYYLIDNLDINGTLTTLKTKWALGKSKYFFRGKPSIIISEENVEYINWVEKIDKTSTTPFKLILDTIGFDEVYCCKYRNEKLFDTLDEMLSTLTPIEEIVIRTTYYEFGSPEMVYRQLGLPDNNALVDVFEKRVYRKALRKLRHPRNFRKIRNMFSYHSITNKMSLRNLEWRWSDAATDNAIKAKISKLINFDYILSAFSSTKISNNNQFIFIEVLHNGKFYRHLLNVDMFDEITLINISDADKVLIDLIIKDIKLMHAPEREHHYGITIEEMDLSVRTYNCLKRSNYCMLDKIIETTEDELYYKVKNLGRKSLDELIKKVEDFGYYLDKNGRFYFRGMVVKQPANVLDFAEYYCTIYSKNNIEDEKALKEHFVEHCKLFGFDSNNVEWFIDMFADTTLSLNDINVVNKINNVKLIGSLILKKWQYITDFNESLLSTENRIWFVVAFNRLYQIAQDEEKEYNLLNH